MRSNWAAFTLRLYYYPLFTRANGVGENIVLGAVGWLSKLASAASKD
jgi:hypothetical protein